MYKNKDSTNYKRYKKNKGKIMNIVKQDNVIREIKSLPRVEKRNCLNMSS